MAIPIPTYMTRAELLDASIVFARRYSFDILRATLPVLVAAILVDVAIELLDPQSDSALLVMLPSLILWGLAEAVALAACWDLLHGTSPSASRAWSSVAPRLGAVAVGYCVKWLLITLGFLLLIAPGVYLIGRWFAVPVANVVEGAGLRDAFRRSRQLARQDLKRILLTLGVVEVALGVLAVSLPAILPGGSVESPSLIQTLFYWIAGIMLLPFRAGLMALLYLDIRMRREGYDLQMGFRGLEDAP